MTLRDDLLELKSHINDCLEIVQKQYMTKNEQSFAAEFERSVAEVGYFARRAEHAVDIGDFLYLIEQSWDLGPEEVDDAFVAGETAISNINKALCKIDGVDPMSDLLSVEDVCERIGRSQSWFSKNVRHRIEPTKTVGKKEYFEYSEISKVLRDLKIDWKE